MLSFCHDLLKTNEAPTITPSQVLACPYLFMTCYSSLCILWAANTISCLACLSCFLRNEFDFLIISPSRPQIRCLSLDPSFGKIHSDSISYAAWIWRTDFSHQNSFHKNVSFWNKISLQMYIASDDVGNTFHFTTINPIAKKVLRLSNKSLCLTQKKIIWMIIAKCPSKDQKVYEVTKLGFTKCTRCNMWPFISKSTKRL